VDEESCAAAWTVPLERGKNPGGCMREKIMPAAARADDLAPAPGLLGLHEISASRRLVCGESLACSEAPDVLGSVEKNR
jgi:hypothetical protein